MALRKKNNNLSSDNNTGFSNIGNSTGGRFFTREGKANVIKRGSNIFSRHSWYHTMLEMSSRNFLLSLLGFFVFANLVFAGIYYLIGIDHLAGVNTGSPWKNFTEVFFFSAQTFTTVGYGRISPTGLLTSAVSTFEAFIGLLTFAIATGLFYGRFSRPRAFIKFSDNILVSPYRDGRALMFRMVPYKNNTLSEAEVKLTMAITSEENGKITDKFYGLDVELSRINSLALSWTVVHPITEESPLYEFSEEDLRKTDIEVFVFVKAFDEVFSNNVIARTSYISSEIVYGAKFKLMYHPSSDLSQTVIELDKLNSFDKISLPEPAILQDSSIQA